MSASFSPQIGERFAGRYELMSPLRSDGAVRAFLAADHHAGLDVALLLLEPACAHPNAWAAFARVVAAATAGKIAGLVLPQGVVSAPPVPPFCLAEPRTLRGFDKLRDQGPMSWRRALMLGERTAEILLAAHAATGVAHRALTPSRCTVTVRDDVKVLDFGMAELELGRRDEAGYRAPEQRQGGGDTRSDAYALALILFELISSQKSAGKTPPPLRSLVAVPRSVDEFMARALSQDPAQRPDLAAMRAGLRELLGVAVAPVEATPAVAPRPDPISPVSMISAAPAATPRSKPGAGVGAGPALANVASQPARPSARPAALSAAPLMPRPQVDPPRPPPTVAPRGDLPTLHEKLEAMRRPAVADRTEILPPISARAAAVSDRTEILPPISARAAAVSDRTEILPPASPARAAAVSDRTEILPPISARAAAVSDRTEILPPASPARAPAVTDRTEIFPVSPIPAPAVTDRTEIFPVSPTPASAVSDRTEIVPSVHRPTPANLERTEIVGAGVTTVREEEKTAPGKGLRGPLALAQAKASAAVPVASPRSIAGDDPSTGTIAEPPLPADTTLLLPPEPARPVPTVGPPPFDPPPREPVAVRPTAEVRAPAADPAEATAARASSSKPAGGRFNKASIWISVLCFAGLVVAVLWLLMT
ncbi:hypothetical protein [Nannocystis pusilla]|uniref:Protein kinase domain-containing protein n=1 Tax=Nannocystis pusilla TaxID=889268 RepID=A0ABS7U4A3_9BACT|nr:hypothetical protein [Nannocystis pusilla]MBZ5715392.1 hypothetical protein [Nannocystis pusilla]